MSRPIGLGLHELLSGTDDARYQFTGHERDGDSDFDNLEAREYLTPLGRFNRPDPKAEQYPGISPYVYAAGNPLKFVDPDGRVLKSVKMRGFSRETPGLKERSYLVDTKIANAVVSFVQEARKAFPNLSVNNTFRVGASSSINTTDTKAVGLSRHQAGFAIDLNGVGKLSKEDLEKLNKIAEKHGFTPLNNQNKDLPHFSANPTEHGYQSLKEAVEENKKDSQERFQDKETESETNSN